VSPFSAYRHARFEGHFDAIVIGSGIGGLGIAGLLAKLAHKRVLVLERHYAVGGFTHTFKRPGYEWDVGVHYVGGVHDPSSNERRWLEFLTEGRLDWASMGDVYDRFLIGSEAYAFPAGRERWRETLKQRFSRDANAIDAYLAATKASTKWMTLYFAEKALPPALGAVAGPLMRAPFLRWGGRTTLEVLRGITNNQQLIGVLAGQWGDYGLPPAQSSFAAHAAIAEHYFNGAAYPAGGASQIAVALLPPIEREGGQVISSADVRRVLTSDGRAIGVQIADDRELFADLVISDAGAITTYGRLIEDQPATAKVLSEIRRLQRSPGYVCLYVGLDVAGADAGLPKANLWVHPTKDHDANWQRFAADPEAPMSLYLSFPSEKDPTFKARFPGRSTVEILTFVPYEWFARWEQTRWARRGADYDVFKARFKERLTEALFQHVPGARGHVAWAELSTPLSTRHFVNQDHGEAYGLGHTPARFRMRSLGPRTPIEHLYLTGADVGLCGVMGALSGAALCASVVLRRNVFGELSRKPARDRNASPAA
jgi:all-trans-retinol 13,14-reductase